MNQNPFHVQVINPGSIHKIKDKQVTPETYLALWKEVKNRNYSKFYKELGDYFKQEIPFNQIHQIALNTQITLKKSPMLYLHGFLLYASLLKYAQEHKNIPLFILETGTARGFSSTCMAYALE